MLALVAAFSLVSCEPPAEQPHGPIRVTVVAVLATDENKEVDPKLKELAREVRKHDPKLTGFRVAASEGKSLAVGESVAFTLVDRQKLTVTVEKPKDGNGRVGLSIKPPELGEITYTCICDKFFPVVTPYRTKAGETLIIAVMAKPCTKK